MCQVSQLHLNYAKEKKVVCDSLLFSYQKWKWVHKALESLRADLVITANKRPGRSRKLPKINPCFCAWTLFTQSCCYRLSGECCTPKNTPKAEHFRELFSEIWWQLTIETDTLCQNRILRDFAWFPVLTRHKSFPDQLLVWAGGSCSSLPSSHPHCCRQHTEPRKPARNLRNPTHWLPLFHCSTRMCHLMHLSSPRKLLYLDHFNAIQHQCGIQTHENTKQGLLQQPSFPAIPLPQVLLTDLARVVLSSNPTALLTTHLISRRLSWDLFCLTLVLSKRITLQCSKKLK